MRYSPPILLALAIFGCGPSVPPSRGRATPLPLAATAPRRVPPARPKPPPAPEPEKKSRAGDGEIGTGDPIAIETVSPDGGWVVFCQARTDTDGDGKIGVRVGAHGKLEGDRMIRYFARGSGKGEMIESLAASDPSGRWVVLQKSARYVLYDTLADRETDLDALGFDRRNDALPYRSHRSLAFDGTGSELLYLATDGTHESARLRSLADGHEVEIDPGPGDVWRVGLDFSGSYALFEMLVDDTNNDQRLTWIRRRAGARSRRTRRGSDAAINR